MIFPVTGFVIVGLEALKVIRSAPQYSVGDPTETSLPVLVLVTILQN